MYVHQVHEPGCVCVHVHVCVCVCVCVGGGGVVLTQVILIMKYSTIQFAQNRAASAHLEDK